MHGSPVAMATSDVSNMGPAPMASGPAPGSSGNGPAGWLGSQSIFDQKDERKLGRAMSVSIVIHGLLLLLLVVGIHHAVVTQQQPPVKFDVVFLQQPGPGGGGGGSPAPAPPKKLELPHPKPVEPVPVPVPVPVIPPPPTLNAPVQTNLSQVIQAPGTSSVSLSQFGGGG